MRMIRREFMKTTSAVALGATFAPFLRAAENPDEERRVSRRNVMVRNVSDFDAARKVFATGKGDVAFLGGSITEMNGYRPMVCEHLEKSFPQTKFRFVAAGVSSTCSDVGAFRLESDVLRRCEKGAPDLFFVEFAVNDDQDGFFSYEHAARSMEGVIRHVKRVNRDAAIVMTFFVNENLMESYRDGKIPTSIRAHEAVAKRYGVTTVNMAKEIQTRIDDGEITWEEYGGVHPSPRGARECADMIDSAVDAATKSEPDPMRRGVRDFPAPIDPFCYSDARWRGFDGVATNDGEITDAPSSEARGFRLFVPDWSKIPGSFRSQFEDVACLCAEKPGAEARFEFQGNAVALYILAGPDAGMIECRVDDGEFRKIDAFHPYSEGLHYPRALMLADALTPGAHVATIRVAEEKNAKSRGTALRVMQIGVNRSET